MSNSCAKIVEHQRREAASRASEDVTAPKSSTTNSGDEASETLDDEVIGASVRAGISCAEQRATAPKSPMTRSDGNDDA